MPAGRTRNRPQRPRLPSSFVAPEGEVVQQGGVGGASAGTTDATHMVLRGKSGYTRMADGSTIRGSYSRANLAPYMGNVMGNTTGFARPNGERFGVAGPSSAVGPSGWQSTIPGVAKAGNPIPYTQPPVGLGGGGGGGRQRQAGALPGQPGGLGGRPVVKGGGGKPHTQIGQQGAGKGKPKGNGGGGAFKPGGFPQPTGGPQASEGIGGFPKMPSAPANFLPMTPGYERDFRSANDELSAAEGSYAIGQTMLPAQMELERARLGTDKSVATDRLKEQLAARGIFTPYGAESTAGNPVMSQAPAGGGVGESLYGRHVATPYGREEQDLASRGAGQYADLAQQYGGAQLGFNQQMFDALLQRAGDAYSAMPLGASYGDYELPGLPGPMFTQPPTNLPGKGKGGRPGKGKGSGRQRPKGKR